MRAARGFKCLFLLVGACGDEAVSPDAGARASDAGVNGTSDAARDLEQSACPAGEDPVGGRRVDEQRQCIGEPGYTGCHPSGPGVACADAMHYARDAQGVLWEFPDGCVPRGSTDITGYIGYDRSCAEADALIDAELSAIVEGESVRLSVQASQPLYVMTCSGELALSAQREGQWQAIALTPRAVDNYILNGEEGPQDLGCDVRSCTPLIDQTISRNEVVSELTYGIAPGQGQLPRFSTRLASMPLRLEVSAFSDAECRTAVTLPFVEVKEPLALPTPLTTIIRIRNQSASVRSRPAIGCGGRREVNVPVYRAEGDSTYHPRCAPQSCDSVPDGVVLDIGGPCPLTPACVSPRFDLAPGASEPDFVYTGVAERFTDRNCLERVPLAAGTPMLARVCYGSPAEGDIAIAGNTCKDVPFGYGQPTLDIALD